MNLDIKFVGTGGAFETNLCNSSAIVQLNGKQLLIDCGHSVFPKLVKLNLAKTIDGVLITHLHDDHVGSLSSLILYHDIVLQKGKLKIYSGNAGAMADLKGYLGYSLGDVDARADFRLVEELSGVSAIDTFGRHVMGMQTFGFAFTNGNESIAYSGDNGDPDYFLEIIGKLNLPKLRIFHELCYFQGLKAHPHYSQLHPYLNQYVIFGYHCDHLANPSDNLVPLVGNNSGLNYES